MIRPLNDRIAVKELPAKASGYILRPEIAEPLNIRFGQIVAIGPGKRFKSGKRQGMEVKAGDVVAFGRLDDYCTDEFIMIQEADIIGIIDNA